MVLTWVHKKKKQSIKNERSCYEKRIIKKEWNMLMKSNENEFVLFAPWLTVNARIKIEDFFLTEA